MYRMLEIANHADTGEEVKAEYVIDGIIDEEVHKSMLYGAASIKELSKRLIAYEEQKSRRTKSVAKSVVKSARVERNNSLSQCGSATKTRCYNCGDEEHVCTECSNKSKGPKCFKRNFTLGKFPTDIIIDGELYHITIHVVPNTAMQHSLLIGTDFLDTVEINMKGGNIFIHRIKDENPDRFPEVLKVDIETGAREVDLSRVENVQRKQAVAVPMSACLKDTVVTK